MAGGEAEPAAGHSGPRKRPNFSARTALEDGSRLDPADAPASETSPLLPQGQSAGPRSSSTAPASSSSQHGATGGFFGRLFGKGQGQGKGEQETNGEHDGGHPITIMRRASLSSHTGRNLDILDKKEKTGDNPPDDGSSGKLGTFSGVFVPTTLNVLSILMFLRFGFILGQGGVLGMMGMLIASYAINLVTTMSISAIATNGTVRGGGAYYLISRSLGPEFGGSIGIVFYLGSVFNTGMNAVGLVDCLSNNFGTISGNWYNFMEEGFWWNYLWGSIVVILCTAICLAGSSIFSRASSGLLVILLVATFSIPVSAIFQKPFHDPKLGIEFTGFNSTTFLTNLKPHLTKGAAGSQADGRESFQNLFGILFPATGGIFAGASMSGDLKHPSKAIPKGTLYGLGLTFFSYALVILVMAATITRASFYNNTNVIQDINLSATLVLLGEFATSFFSSLMGLIGSAKLLQAVARDSLLPGLSIFGQGTKKSDEPTYAIILTFIVAQLTMLFDINRIASFITMTYLMTFLVTNLACFLLKVGSAPNFRPSFHYFNWQTAASGALISGACMFFVDGLYASGCVGVLIFLFLLIHYTSPPKTWGDVSQSLIYHQVRKYLLRLRQEHVKFWRPQILLFVNDYETQYKMIHFCNSLKKGALFVLGHVIVTQDFASAVPEARRKQNSWTKFIGFSKVKAFINISVSPSAEWGMRNVVLNSGLGGMRPNIVVIDQFRRGQSIVDVSRRPTSRSRRDSRAPSFFQRSSSSGENDGSSATGDNCTFETGMGVQSYLTILEDLLFQLRINVAVAKGFEDLDLPGPDGHTSKKYIDLWPIQMSAEIASDGAQSKQNVLTTNFDTYTLILQLGCILHTVPSWKKLYKLRVAVFVEYETDVEEERGRVKTLLDKLRIEAEVLVFWLASGQLKSYQVIVNGEKSVTCKDALQKVNSTLENEEWWQDMQNFRKTTGNTQEGVKPGSVAKLLDTINWPTSSFQHSRHRDSEERFGGLKKFMENSRRRRSIGSIGAMGVNLGMQTHRLSDAFVQYQADTSGESSSSESEEDHWFTEGEEGSPESITPAVGSSSRPQLPYGLQDAAAASSETALLSTSSSEADIPHLEQQEQQHPPQVTTTSEDGGRAIERPSRPFLPHSASNKFSSSPIPETRVNTEEGTGPSIMFADDIPTPKTQQSQPERQYESIYSRAPPTGQPAPASGYPQQASIPLGFNDLPCRAQHLILNELMVMNSSETAVAFTTLPSPMEGTWQDEAACESYVSDLEVLYQGLPPCLLVHSNSMTVTMNL